ncbi:hypothetical protein B0T17DRAFT_538844 [Bombardia bombarda]|uniref:FAD-binding PCMH-type domain-containing protein n=1 Tax=Bombardia bombarda TaxID=252184 RepID=A0AA40BVZ5_9PEZI|nr:hypothetical protein B0T17DRAFT_538844 [Bombardia bombarda]
MVRLLTLAAHTLALLKAAATATATPDVAGCPDSDCSFSQVPLTQANLTASKVQQDLGPLLSKKTNIYGSDDSRYEHAIGRWQAFAAPQFTVIVEVAAEDDVSKVVKYANENSVPFYTVNRAHGGARAQGDFSGIQINVVPLSGIQINPDGKTARFQGGAYDQEAIDVLWEQGYVGTTGSCGCVGMMGPGLGGGHGRYQGLHGLISDNLIKMDVVLASGESVEVSSESHPDLFWAMQGAGHNFGIVTSFEMKIHPRVVDTWFFRNWVFTQDKLEDLFEALNKINGNGTQPGEMAVVFGFFYLDPTFSETEAVIWWSMHYAGPQEDAEPYFEPLNNLGHINVTEGNVPYTQIPHATRTGEDDPLCDHGMNHVIRTAGLQVYNITTQREIYNLFNQNIKDHPEFAASYIVMEAYSVEAVKKVDHSASAFSQRDENLLVQISVTYPPEPSLDETALEWAGKTRDLFNEGQPGRLPSTYINYGLGDESLESIYGYEPWRLEKLRGLKHKYDPENRFRYYVPIIRD